MIMLQVMISGSKFSVGVIENGPLSHKNPPKLSKMSLEDRRSCIEASSNITEGTNGFWGQLAPVHYPLKDGLYKESCSL